VQPAAVARAVDHARLDDDEREPLGHHRQRDVVVRLPFGAVVLAQVRPVVAVPLVGRRAAGVGEYRDGARVHPFGDAELAHHLENVPGASDVDPFGNVAGDADLVPRGAMEDAVGAAHRLDQTVGIDDVPLVQLDTERPENARLAGIADQRRHPMAAADQLLRQFTAEEPGGPGDEIAAHAQIE
jgi:hypothetical protein